MHTMWKNSTEKKKLWTPNDLMVGGSLLLSMATGASTFIVVDEHFLFCKSESLTTCTMVICYYAVNWIEFPLRDPSLIISGCVGKSASPPLF